MVRVLVKNASLWQWDDERSKASKYSGGLAKNQSLIIEDGYIRGVEEDSPLLTTDDFDTVIDAMGFAALPGLIDSHIHVGMLGESQFYIDLHECSSVEMLLETISSKLSSFDDLPFIVGFNWDQSLLGRVPTRSDLDSLPTAKPIFLWRACWHVGVANTAALSLGGYLDCFTAIQGGEVILDAGMLKERATEPLMEALSKFKTSSQREYFLRNGLERCRRSGLTCVQTNDEDSWQIYDNLASQCKLPLRVLLTPMMVELDNVIPLQRKLQLIPGNDENKGRLALERVKVFSDGSLGADTAAIRSSSTSSSSHRGILAHSSESLQKMFAEATAAGLRLEVHAIGDAAAEQVLTAMKEVVESQGLIVNRPILTHCQILGEDCVSLMKEIGAIANVQPSFVPTDMRWLADRHLSEQQERFAYAWKTLLENDVVVAGGSDAPIESCNPFRGMFDAIFRSNANRVYRPEECLTFSEALWLYTKGGAYAAGYESVLGELKVGYLADIVFIPETVVEQPELLRDLSPSLTLVGGQVVVDNGRLLIAKEGQLSRHCGGELNGPGVEINGAELLPGKAGRPMSLREQHEGIVRRGYCRCCVLSGSYCFTSSQAK
eukprot:scaffold4011_cov197-Ochromonas_danica.AAC.35